jgi:hypothetical protein
VLVQVVEVSGEFWGLVGFGCEPDLELSAGASAAQFGELAPFDSPESDSAFDADHVVEVQPGFDGVAVDHSDFVQGLTLERDDSHPGRVCVTWCWSVKAVAFGGLWEECAGNFQRLREGVASFL